MTWTKLSRVLPMIGLAAIWFAVGGMADSIYTKAGKIPWLRARSDVLYSYGTPTPEKSEAPSTVAVANESRQIVDCKPPPGKKGEVVIRVTK